ncbi:hypothetical protein EOA32_01105 [Mesorhizobium sp. M1A.F.Ca.ET.072.01.1.1]|uniref:DUF5906 domain-containing protein n=1 Tax=Mesorhizobium sp. M1A.F.Ca.ET.072.01.1.1 TaxID=2496753 RepID=UPI000FD3E873|nr:DUF5906 domain-containing protein [Mesorhizobium sp. M1A.F.Ca.ET.072.01.1.1]RUW55648.1 hypothetical protein EOA32_01105 [Mesorhizobium sp. M1A.F.Ca.ET.072.01.1.1]
MQDYSQAFAHITALTGQDANTAFVNFRCIHDVDKGVPAHSYDGTLPQLWQSLLDYQSRGYGVFININELDGNGRELANVQRIRTHVVDFDNLSALQNFERAATWYPAPSFAVQTSPNKFHAYWISTPYRDNDRYTLIQRKLRQLFDGDKSVIDPTRVLRLAGTLHLKKPSAPHTVRCWSLPGFGYVTPPEALEAALAGVNVLDSVGVRQDLGTANLAAPSLDWIRFALKLLDPNDLDYPEWLSTTAAVKQAGWSLVTHEQELFDLWSEWCARYGKNDHATNLKAWNSIRQTEVGWPSLQRRVPSLIAYQTLATPPSQPQSAPGTPQQPPAAPPMPAPPELDCSGEMLTHMEQQTWFKGCVFVGRFGQILTPAGRLMNATQFNGHYGGKKFIIDGTGKVTNEAWQAATRSTLWTVPKVDHIRFLPSRGHMEIITDALDRQGVNTYKPIKVEARPGDPSPFLNHLAAMLPVEADRRILLDFIAHNARYPGHKIPWSPLVQSAEGVGKGVLKRVIKHVMGGPYVHFPNAKEMVESGSKFNAWMRAKLFILVDEIKVDERRDMIEVLKPMISEEEIEIQGKFVDQDKEDNYSNWAFFSNFKDAIPVNRNGRRFAIFYSAIQSVDDLLARGMDQRYFDALYPWLDNGGKEIVAHYLLNYPIERGAIPMRAPETSSSVAAIRYSRGPVEQMILDAVDDQLPGFRGGWVSATAVANRLKATGARAVSPKTIGAILEALQFHEIGRSTRAYFQEDAGNRSQLFNVDRAANVADFGRWQGYE